MNTEQLPRTIGFYGGTAIVVGVIVGSGIFRAPTTLAAEIDVAHQKCAGRTQIDETTLKWPCSNKVGRLCA